jgi:predicted MFS family arabinose efflux permease
VSFLVSAVLIGRVRVADLPVDPAPAGGLLRRARDGMALVLRHPYLRSSLACATTINFFNLMVSALVILYASRHLGLSAGLIGLALGAGATGGLLATIVIGRLSRVIGVGRTIAIGAVLFSAPFAFVPLAGGPVWARAATLGLVEFVSAFGVMCFDVPLNALMTAVTPDPVRSRMVGAFSTVNYGIRPAGAIVGGLLGDAIGVGPTMVVAAIGGTLAFVWLLPSPIVSTRSIDDIEVPPAPVGTPA